MQFQATCSKGNKKLTLTLNANDNEEARLILHNQGYSIIDIQVIPDTTTDNTVGNFFYFDAKVNGILQSGKIQSTDIFKSYRKLVEDLKYDVIYIYANADIPEDEKKIITAKVKDGYRLYKESIGQDVDEEDTFKGKSKDEQEMGEISGEVLKELDKYMHVLDSSVEKIQNIFLKYKDVIQLQDKMKLEELQNALIQTKGTKNLGKMKMTVENGLRSIGEIELNLIKVGMTEEKKKFLEETNALLKQVGSRDRIQTEDEIKQSINYKLTNFFNKPTTPDSDNADGVSSQSKEKKDVSSFIYYKNKREIDIYKKKLQETQIALLKAIISFDTAQARKLFLKRKLVSQNIQIINNRLSNRVISYTRIVHGFEYYIKSMFSGVGIIADILYYAIFLYSVAYIILTTLNSSQLVVAAIHGKAILFIVILSLAALVFSYIRNFISLLLLPVLLYIVYFLSINF